MGGEVLVKVNIPGFEWLSGKVRDWAVVDSALGFMAVVATDRISVFDAVLPTPVPMKGVALNQLSNFWKKYLESIIPNDIVSTDYLNILPYLNLTPQSEWAECLMGRIMLARVAQVVPVECVVRGYIRESGRLPQPIFTPTTKAVAGHDEKLTYDGLVNHLELWLSEHPEVKRRTSALVLAQALKSTSLALYTTAFKYAWERGIIIADTKFEFGFINGELILIDEVLTPDSSRFWAKRSYAPGRPQKSFDKQIVRDWLSGIGWDKQKPAPEIPQKIVRATIRRYQEVEKRLMREIKK